MIAQALSLHAAPATVADATGAQRQVVRITITTTEARHVREQPAAPVVRTEWVSADRIFELPVSVLDETIEKLGAVRAQIGTGQ